MNSIFLFLVKEHIIILILCILAVIIGVSQMGAWSIVLFLFVFFFFYEWNVLQKINKNLAFIESLNISLNKRYVIFVLFPFVFSGIIFLFQNIAAHVSDDYINIGFHSFRISSTLLLGSILATGFISFIGWIIALYLICYIFKSFYFYEISAIIISLSLSYYFLSNQRALKKKSLLIPIIIALALLLFGNLIHVFFYSTLLDYSNLKIQRYVVHRLIEDNSYLKNRYFFQLNANNYYDATLNKQLLIKIENVVLAETECKNDCQVLAHNVGLFQKDWNLKRISSCLYSSSETQQIYALLILKNSDRIFFLDRIQTLSKSSNIQVFNLAISMLNKWRSLPPFLDETEEYQSEF